MDRVAVFKEFEEFFKQLKIRYKWNEDNSVMVANFALGSKIGNIKEYIYVRPDSYTVRALCPLHADIENRNSIAEYLMRANYGLILGNFEMDFQDGEILYKVTQSISNDHISRSDIENSIIMPLAMFKRYGEGLMKVAFSLATPEEAIEEAERIEDTVEE